MKFVCDFFDEASGDFCVVGAYCDEFDGPFSHGEAFTGGRKVLEHLLRGLFRLCYLRSAYGLSDEFDGPFNLFISMNIVRQVESSL